MSPNVYDQPRGFRRSILSVAILSLSAGLSGCLVDGDRSTSTSNSNDVADSVTNPTQDVDQQVQITGSVQGVLRDRVSGDPISGAVISVGLKTATTDELGQYVLSELPVTSPTFTSNNGGDESYQVTIDLRDASSGSDYPYPDFYYTDAKVTFGRFTPLQAESMEGENLQQGTFHQIISGLVSAYDPQVGKLSTSVSGKVVAGLGQLGLEPHAPLESATVYLYQTMGIDDDQRSNRVVGQTTTDAEGNFSFDRIEAGAELEILAFYNDGYNNEYSGTTAGFDAPEKDGEEIKFSLLSGANIDGLRGPALQLSLLEEQGPVLSSVTPENYSNLTLEDNSLEVRFQLNRSVRDNAYAKATDADGSAIAGLYQDVVVTYNGTKVEGALRDEADEPRPNYTLSWDDDYQVLVVSMKNLVASAKYTVDISNTEGPNKLVDNLNRQVSLSGSHASVASPTLEFTTRGDGAPAIPEATLAVSSVNTGDNIFLQWPRVDNARLYRVYTQHVELNGEVDTYLPGYWETAEVSTASYSTAGNLTSANGHPVALYFMVTAVNSDGSESDYSEVIGPITDTVAPKFEATGATVNVTGTEFTLDLDEAVREMLDEDGTTVEILLQDANEDDIEVVNVEATQNDTAISVEVDNAIAIPSFDDLSNEILGQVRTGWNGVWRASVEGDLNEHSFSHERVNPLPPMSTGLCMTVDGEHLFSRNSDDYENGEIISLTLAGLNRGDDQVVMDPETGTGYVYTGANGRCESITALLNFYHAEDNNPTADGPWITAAENAGDAVVDHDYSAVASWALTELNTALLSTITINVDPSYFRISNRAESLTQLAAAGVNEFWTNPTDLSLPTLSQLTQGDDQSRPGSAATLDAVHHYILDGTAPAAARPGVLYFEDDATQANFAWRGTANGPATNVVSHEFRPIPGAANWEGLETDVTASGHTVTPYSLSELVRSVEILRIVPGAVRDIAGNENRGHTLIRTYTRSDDLTTTDEEDSYRED